jgi:hypothetical protein
MIHREKREKEKKSIGYSDPVPIEPSKSNLDFKSNIFSKSLSE